jgi:hypothetical protein
VGVPVGLFGESLVDAVVEVLVVREDNVAADIVELSMAVSAAQLRLGDCVKLLTKPSGVTSVEARPPGISLESTINQDWSLSWFRRFAAPRPVGPAPMTRTSTSLYTMVSSVEVATARVWTLHLLGHCDVQV